MAAHRNIRTSVDFDDERARRAWRGVREDRLLRAGVAIAIVACAASMVDTLVARGAVAGLFGAAAALSALGGAVLCVVRRVAPRRTWSLLSAGLALNILAEAFHLIGTGSAFDVGYDVLVVAASGVGTAGLLFLFPLASSNLRRALLDSAALVATLVAVGIGGLISAHHAFGSTYDFGLTLTWTVTDVLALVAVVVIAGAHRRFNAQSVLLGLGLTVSALADLALLRVILDGGDLESTPIGVAWQVFSWLIVLAAIIALRHPAPAPAARVLSAERGVVAVALGCVASLTAYVIDSLDGRGSAWLLLVLVCSVIVVVLRILQLGAEQRRAVYQLYLALSEQERLAVTDALTGLHNRRFLDETLRRELVRRTTVAGAGLSLVALDVDHFKHVNDRFGHEVGDLVLKEVALRLSQAARARDLVARWGGEEFAILLTDTSRDEAQSVAERFVACMRPSITTPGGELDVTISAGVSSSADHPAADDLMRCADQALYAAKHRGRDRLVVGV